jgi:predicted dehydrogenase
VVLHAGALVAAHGLRFAVHGTHGSYLKYGMDPQEDALRDGRPPGQAGWGKDPQPGTLFSGAQDAIRTEVVESVPGDYLRYYSLLRDAILLGNAPPVTTAQALRVMSMLEWGTRSSNERREIACTPVP